MDNQDPSSMFKKKLVALLHSKGITVDSFSNSEIEELYNSFPKKSYNGELCPTCGCPCDVGGKNEHGTHYYIPRKDLL